MELTCIVCPNGCQLTAQKTGRGLVITGNKCPKGAEYGKQEMTDPRRVVTGVVRTTSSQWPCVPVKTTRAVPKKAIPGLLKELYSLQVTLPVKRGETLIGDFDMPAAEVVFTRTVPPAEKGEHV